LAETFQKDEGGEMNDESRIKRWENADDIFFVLGRHSSLADIPS
jgi:hypothetical protein